MLKIKYLNLKKVLGLIFVLSLLGIAFLKFGRSLYMPVVHKIKGKETLQSVISKLEDPVWDRLKINLERAGYKMDYPKEILLVGLKEERILKVYAKGNSGFNLVKTYPFTGYSGKLGPKLKEGDKQIPEGIYEVEYLNPNSSYYLSIKVNYPNEFDKSKTEYDNVADMGDNIFIHGKSATIGCIPIGDEAIEEVFLLTQKAINKRVKVIISPRDFNLNPTFPEIDNIDWERELYIKIHEELKLVKED